MWVEKRELLSLGPRQVGSNSAQLVCSSAGSGGRLEGIQFGAFPGHYVLKVASSARARIPPKLSEGSEGTITCVQ